MGSPLLDILDALRRIVSRWVETATPITVDLSPGDTTITVQSTRRFNPGDEVMIESPLEGETNLIIDEIVDDTTLVLSTPVYNAWSESENIVLRKLIYGRYIEGIYIGDPAVIPMYPAITINGTSNDSEAMAISAHKERFEVQLTVYADDENYEDAYRFVVKIADAIKEGLKKNFYPLVNDYDTSAIVADIAYGDEVIQVADSSIFVTPLTDTSAPYPWTSDARCIIEDRWKSEETRVQEILGPNLVTIRPLACRPFRVADNAIAIRPRRHIFNSWPHHVDIGHTAKGSLLQAASIHWFAEEAVLFDFHNNDPHLK